MEERHAQGLDLTILRAWFGGGERGKTYFEVLARTLLGEVSCWDDIPPKRSKAELEPLGAYHEG